MTDDVLKLKFCPSLDRDNTDLTTDGGWNEMAPPSSRCKQDLEVEQGICLSLWRSFSRLGGKKLLFFPPNRQVKRPVEAFKFDICDFSHNTDRQKGRGHHKRRINHCVLLLYVFIWCEDGREFRYNLVIISNKSGWIISSAHFETCVTRPGRLSCSPFVLLLISKHPLSIYLSVFTVEWLFSQYVPGLGRASCSQLAVYR